MFICADTNTGTDTHTVLSDIAEGNTLSCHEISYGNVIMED